MGRYRNMPESIRNYIARQTTRKEPFKGKPLTDVEHSFIPYSDEDYNKIIKKLSFWLGDPNYEIIDGKEVNIFAKYEEGEIIELPSEGTIDLSGIFAKDTSLIEKFISHKVL